MNKKNQFVHKLLNKLGKIDPQSLQGHVEDLAQEQACLAEILDLIEEGIVLIRLDGSIGFANQSAKRLLDLETPQIDKKKDLNWINDSELRSFVDSNLHQLDDKVVKDLTVLSPREAHLRAMLVELSENNQKELQRLLILTDLTVQQAPQDWNDKIKRIESLVKLAAGIAHEIGNPLNSIGIHLQILRKHVEKLPQSQQDQLLKTIDVLNDETSRLDKIIRDFLKATRKPPIRFKTDDLKKILTDAIQFMQPELEAQKIEASLDFDENIPQFMMDRERLYPAFINLIKNAAEAMTNGGQLAVTASVKEKIAVIEFKDTGCGIENENLPYIFDAYFTTKEEGSGLGLMTVFDALHDHKGRVEAKSEPGKGTSIVLLLPIRQPKLQLPG